VWSAASATGEARVALVPELVGPLIQVGYAVAVESRAGGAKDTMSELLAAVKAL